MTEPWTEADDAIEEVREIRRRISARFDDDPVKLVEHYMEVQKQYAERLIEAPPKRHGKCRPAA
jgi:hypothetical protein